MDTGNPNTPRWVQRFENFDRAMLLLQEAVELLDQPDLHPMMKEGAIQRFEFSFELGWKTLMNYLDWRKVTLDRRSAADVIRTAFASGYLQNGQDWMDALDARNHMSHVYQQEIFDKVLSDVKNRFYPCFEDLREMLLMERESIPLD
jgi:nucleotidyltransferase substrate binding protein (TIGR01987 family)